MLLSLPPGKDAPIICLHVDLLSIIVEHLPDPAPLQRSCRYLRDTLTGVSVTAAWLARKSRDEAVYRATRKGDVALVRALFHPPHRSTPNSANPAGISALDHASDSGRLDIVGELLRAGASPGGRALYYATCGGHIAIVRALLAAGASPDAVTISPGVQPIPLNNVAAFFGRLDIVQALCDAGAHPHKAIILAAQGGHLDIVQALCGAKATQPGDLDRRDGSQTALMIAAESGHLEMARVLIGAGASPHIEDHEGNTALVLAAKRKHFATVRFLVDRML
jgi:ankyrin repeat protein